MHFPQLITELAGNQLTMGVLSIGREGGQVTRSSLGGLCYDVKLCWSLWKEKERKSASTWGNTYVALTHAYMHNITRKDEHLL